MYTLYKFHFLNRISEINLLFDDILIIWPAPVYHVSEAHDHNQYTVRVSTQINHCFSPNISLSLSLSLSVRSQGKVFQIWDKMCL